MGLGRASVLVSILGCIFNLLAVSCDIAQASAFAKVIAEPSECPPGAGASSKVGDILIGNEHLRAVISSVGHAHRGAASGGNIIDAAPIGGWDAIEQVLLFLGRYPRQARYTSVEVIKSGEDGVAIVEARGVDSFTGELKLITQYIVRGGEKFITMRTKVTNNGSVPLKGFMLGDAVQCGRTRIYAPMYGYDATNKTITADWIAYSGSKVAYGMCIKGSILTAINGISWSDVISARVDLMPNESFTYERHFIVAKDIAEAAHVSYLVHGRKVANVIGMVLQKVGGKPITNALVQAALLGKPFVEAVVGNDGSFKLALPEGEYLIKPFHAARSAVDKLRVSVRAGESKRITLRMSAPSFVRFAIYELPNCRKVPGRLTFIGMRGSETPNFGSCDNADGAMNIVASLGDGLRPIAPGWYRIIASRGFEYILHERVLYVPEGKTACVQFFLRRVLNTDGWVAVDPHQHCSNSFDSSVSLKDRIISNLAEGIECLVMTDHDFVTDLSELVLRMGLRGMLLPIPGQEITTRHLGHFNAFPIPPDVGAITWAGKGITEIFSQVRSLSGVQVIQVNHPRIGKSYFNVVQFDPKSGKSDHTEWSTDFDCVEVLNAKMMHTLDEALKDWFALLNLGLRVTATGGSDSHHVAQQEAGYPRCYAFVGRDNLANVTCDDIVRAFRAGQIIVSMGPFVTMTINGKGIGRLVSLKERRAKLRIRVQAAPWVDVSEIRLVENGSLIKRFKLKPTNKILRFDRALYVSPKCDAWYVVLVYGNKPLSPIVSEYAGYDGTRYEVKPFAITNPIWVDANGDGIFTPLGKPPIRH
ncbi:MAG: CehA/McbA family metallohydrolase [Armatimonadota bacterium]|nr:CehA/McbA family metallohydrolase [Armatimonadota bacterium]MCX7777219.1 CehA/McbA family metallohydrolase [Armatimonadota bacterium]MDW8024634.1 CehA/McbA family metallohydrolase [Armatimonadota bacterium]